MAYLEIPYKGSTIRALIDDEDYGTLSLYQWRAVVGQRDGYTTTYISGRVSGKRELLHRFILGAKKGVLVDHINHDTLDNRKSNLRLATRSQNAANRLKSVHSTKGSRFKGVHCSGRRFVATVQVGRVVWRATGFESEETAARAYDTLTSKVYGEFASPNTY